MYKYSERPKTLAERRFEDNVPEEVKGARLTEIINLQQKNSLEANQKQIGKIQKVLVENFSKRSDEHMAGRNDYNTTVIFPVGNFGKCDYVLVEIKTCTAATLQGEVVEILKPSK